MQEKDPIFIIPTQEHITVFVKWAVIVLASFLAIYLTSNNYASSQSEHYHLYTDWELTIPLVPPMILIYFSYVIVFIMVLFVFKAPEAIKGLAYSMLFALVASGVIFVLFPGHLGYERPDHVAGYGILYKLLYNIDQPHNLFPSLHVVFASLCVLSLIQQSSNTWFHTILKIWFVMVCASVILVHQHHLFDIASGFALAWIVYKKVYLKMATKTQIEEDVTIKEVVI